MQGAAVNAVRTIDVAAGLYKIYALEFEAGILRCTVPTISPMVWLMWSFDIVVFHLCLLARSTKSHQRVACPCH